MQEEWQKYWQSDASTGEVFVSKDGAKNATLQHFWAQYFYENKSHTTLDLASGAGSIFRSINVDNYKGMLALDISRDALAKIEEDFVDAKGICASLNALPFEQASLPHIVSQFGIEYGGIEAFEECFRILADEGHCLFLSHQTDSIIDQRSERELSGLALLQSTEFVSLAKKIASAFAANDKLIIESLMQAFMRIEPEVALAKNEAYSEHLNHVYSATKQLLSHFKRYDLQDMLEWFDQTQAQIETNLLRLTSMRQACLSQEDVSHLHKIATKYQIVLDVEVFNLDEGRPLCWVIKGKKGQRGASSAT